MIFFWFEQNDTHRFILTNPFFYSNVKVYGKQIAFKKMRTVRRWRIAI